MHATRWAKTRHVETRSVNLSCEVKSVTEFIIIMFTYETLNVGMIALNLCKL